LRGGDVAGQLNAAAAAAARADADVRGGQALTVAASIGHAAAVEALLEHGAPPLPEAVVAAARCPSVETLQLLLDGGAQLAGRCGAEALCAAAGTVPLQRPHAETAESLSLIRCLLERGARVDAADANGDTPLHLAARALEEEWVGLLLGAGADVHARNNAGDQPLHAACGSYLMPDRLDRGVGCSAGLIARALLERGADVNARGAGGKAPAHHAAASEEPKVVRLLVEEGADLFAVDGAGRDVWEHIPESMDDARFEETAWWMFCWARKLLQRDRQRDRALPGGVRTLIIGAAAEMRRLGEARAATDGDAGGAAPATRRGEAQAAAREPKRRRMRGAASAGAARRG
jgi:hypothetical protein